MIDKKYLAGFIDGEGCFNSARDRKTFFPRLLIGNTNFEILELIRFKYGGDVQIIHSKVPNWKPSGMYRAAGKALKAILFDVYEYLIIKKPQATLCLEMIKNSDRVFRAESHAKMHILNKKGIS